jgi:PEP-CTERM motif
MSHSVSHRGLIASVVGFASPFILSAGTTARAAMVELDFTGAEGNNSGGVYVYPYNFNFNGGSQTYELMCDDFTHEIMAPQNWAANVTQVSSLTDNASVSGLQFPSAGIQGYLEAAYLFGEEVNAYASSNSDPEGLYNWAVWDLMTGVDESGQPGRLDSGDEATVQGYLTAAENQYSEGNLTPSDFSNVFIYTPTPGEMTPGGPQEFLGLGTPVVGVPEPTTFALIGFGAVGLLSRRRRNSSSI